MFVALSSSTHCYTMCTVYWCMVNWILVCGPMSPSLLCICITVVSVNTDHQIGPFSCVWFFLKAHPHLLVIATVKIRHVLKKSWQGVNGRRYKYENDKGSWRKITFLGQDLKTLVFHLDPINFSYLYILLLKFLAMLFLKQFFFTVAITKENVYGLKVRKFTLSPCTDRNS